MPQFGWFEYGRSAIFSSDSRFEIELSFSILHVLDYRYLTILGRQEYYSSVSYLDPGILLNPDPDPGCLPNPDPIRIRIQSKFFCMTKKLFRIKTIINVFL